MTYFRFNEEKALSAILYIAGQLKTNRKKPGFHKVFKIFYFADQKHLARYGCPIIGDYYVAMEHGPVPSRIYDIVKIVRGDSIFNTEKYNDLFEVKNYFINPKKEPDMDEFSETDLECINESIEENMGLNFFTLKAKSHDNAYKKATRDDKIPYQEMARVAGADDEMVAYLETLSENELILSK
jgi:uncharacterized phage-associated protein